MDPAKPSSATRRTFLKAAAITAGTASSLSTVVSAAPVKASVPSPLADVEQTSRGYRESAHVREYYKTLRE